LKQITKIHLKRGNYEQVLTTYREVLDWIAAPPPPGLNQGW
jgi:hypothetical protein